MKHTTLACIKSSHYVRTKPLTLWFLNHDIDTDEARRQALEFKRQGLGGFFMHWINGAAPYMGERWLDSVGELVGMAAATGLEAWLYDEAWCPSCFAGGRILARRPDLRAKSLWHKTCDVEPGGTANIDFELMNPLAVFAAPLVNGVPDMTRVERLDGLLGTAVMDFAPPFRHKDGYYPHVKPLEHWRAAGNGFRWLLQWKAPASSSWRVYVFCEQLMNAGSKTWIDVLNPESVQCFLEETHEKYAARFLKYFGNVIPGIMTDEYKHPPMPWTTTLPTLYAERYSEDLMAALPALVDPSIKNCRQVRINYHRLSSDLFRQNYTAPMASWCRQHNLFLTGHISPEEDLSGEVAYTGNIAAHLRHFDMPGTDLIMQAVGDRERPALNLGPRMASSVARQQGRGRAFVEVGACCDEGLSLEQLKYR